MSRAEKFIQDYTRNCSNEYLTDSKPDGLYAAVDILQKTLGKVDGYQTDDGILEHKCAISAVKSLYGEQKPAEWSEEDDYVIERLFCLLDNEQDNYPQLSSDFQEIEEIKNKLKSLKDRVQPQPKQEWKQENTGDLTDFENAMMHIGGSFFGQHAGLDPNDTNAIKEQANLLSELVPSKKLSEEQLGVIAQSVAVLKVFGYGELGDRLGDISEQLNKLREE